MKPKLIIDSFAGMGDNGLAWAECCAPKKIGGQSVMNPSGSINNWNHSGDTGFSNLDDILAMCDLRVGSGLLDSNNYLLAFDTNGLMYIIDPDNSSNSIGKIHTSLKTQTKFPDILQTINGDILFTNRDTIGIGWYGTCTYGSSTTQIVDAEGRNMSTNLGLSIGDKIYNIDNKEEYTITGFTTTNSTNDTMTFNTGTACSYGQVFYAFRDNAFSFIADLGIKHFIGQPGIGNWHRPIILFGNYYYVLNGNYLGQMPIDQTTWESGANDVLIEDFKQLPYNMQGVCMDVNNDKLLIGGEYKNNGKLILWDGYSDGWLNEIIIDKTPTSIKAYKDGWIVLVRNTIYYTNGYQLQKISTYPSGRGKDQVISTNHNCMDIIDDKILISSDTFDYQRLRNGVLIYYPESGWNYIPMKDNVGNGYRGTSNAIFTYGSKNLCFVSQKITDGNQSINTIDLDQNVGRYSFMYYIKLPNPINIGIIGLNLSPTIDYESIADSTVNVTVNYGDGKDAMFKQAEISGSSTKTLLINTVGATKSTKIGGKIIIVDEDSAGEYTYITAISNGGTNNEELTVSPALSTDPSDSQEIIIQNVKKTKTETITTNELPNELNFEVNNFYSDKLFIEVIVEGTYPIDIHAINVY